MLLIIDRLLPLMPLVEEAEFKRLNFNSSLQIQFLKQIEFKKRRTVFCKLLVAVYATYWKLVRKTAFEVHFRQALLFRTLLERFLFSQFTLSLIGNTLNPTIKIGKKSSANGCVLFASTPNTPPWFICFFIMFQVLAWDLELSESYLDHIRILFSGPNHCSG